MKYKLPILTFCIVCLFATSPLPLTASVINYELVIEKTEVNFTGEVAQAMTVNGGIPGPTLIFTDGDVARIKVHNKMNVESSIHWHGLLVPPGMDGVPNISFPPIAPGTTFTYEFPLRQSGTYWYHSHTSLQEQRGIYGSIVIKPQTPTVSAQRDEVILLSDWTNEDPHTVLRNLRRGSEWYSLIKGSGQSILGAAKVGKLQDYFTRELQRMPAMDIADIAYDCFLANGHAESFMEARPGETVRLRIIDGSATTYFHLEFAGGPMTIIASDGLRVSPVKKERFLIGVAETYDVLVTIPAQGSYEFRATAHDGSGYSSVWLGSGPKHAATNLPKPNLYQGMGHFNWANIVALTPAGSMGMNDGRVNQGKFDQPGMAGMAGMHDSHDMKKPQADHAEMVGMQESGMNEPAEMDHATMKEAARSPAPPEHSGHATHQTEQSTGNHSQHQMTPEPASHQQHVMQTTPESPNLPTRGGKQFYNNFSFLGADVATSTELAVDGMDPRRPGTPYNDLRALKHTAFPANQATRDIRLTLDGDMERYIWTLNNKTLKESDSIHIKEGEVVRFIMINRTMMHHPMHLHGHFFRVINGQGDKSPLKHTVDVAPMSTTVIEFNANEVGDWFFHCHLLYHMKSGMARVVEYDNFTPSAAVQAVRPNLYKDSWYFRGQADLLSHMTEGFLELSNTRHILSADWQAGWQDVEDNEWEGTLRWSYYLNRFTTLFIGQYFEGNEEDNLERSRAIGGLTYLLPLNIESTLWLDSDGESRVALEKSFELTPRLSLYGEVEYDSLEDWQESGGLRYMVNRDLSLTGSWHSEYGLGAGLQWRF